MRKFFFTAAIIFLAALFFCTYAYADAAVYIGSRNIGAVRTLENNSGLFVPVEDLGRLMGFSPSRKGEELWLQRNNIQLRFVDNSAAAWYGFSIVPLYSAPFPNEGKTWLDSSSAASFFQRVAGSGQDNRLRINKISGYTVTANNARSEIEFGDFEEPAPVQPAAAPVQPVNTKTTEEKNQNIPALIIPEVKTRPTQTQAQTPTPTVAAAPEIKIPEQTVAAVTVAAKKSQAKAQTQSKYETFKLNDSKGDTKEIYSGTVQGIRWTSQEGNHKKIRAVVMVDDEAEPAVFMDNKELHALFSSSLENSTGIASPFANVKAEIRKNSNGLDLVFIPSKILKAEKIILSNPKRIVFDFFLSDSEKIVATAPAKTQVQQTVTQPIKPVQPVRPPVITQKKDPVINNQQPTKIFIPTAPTIPQNFGRVGAGKKTVVIDAGHGGKDPGASDNGVTEKNVNLAIALELEKVLAARGYNVVMTRRTDVYLKLQERTDIANNVNADLFVSIHVNALPAKKSMTGFEIYIMALPTDKDAMNLAKIENREYVEGKGVDVGNVDRRTEMLLRILGDMQQNNKISESTDFAAALYNSGVRNGLPMRRVAQAPFFVLRGAGMPAVLLETGFVTNATEAQLLTTQPYQNKIAMAMAEGIINYIK